MVRRFEGARVRPKSVEGQTLVSALILHEPALTVDFRVRYRLRLRDAVREMSWNELWCLVAPLMASPYTHLVAAVQGWQRPPEPIESAAFLLMDYHQLVNRKKNGVKPQPMKRPWETPVRPSREMSAEDTRLRDELKASLGLED